MTITGSERITNARAECGSPVHLASRAFTEQSGETYEQVQTVEAKVAPEGTFSARTRNPPGRRPGIYTITARCQTTNLVATARLRVTRRESRSQAK